MKLTRRTICSGFLGSAAAAVGAFGYGSLIERTRLVIERVQCPVDNPQYAHLRGFRIGLLSDIHFDDFGSPKLVEKAVTYLNREQVDVILLTGDFISDDTQVMPQLTPLLAELKANQGIYSVFGNHDRWHESDLVAQALTQAGVKHLVNETVQLPEVAICGLDTSWGGRPAIKSTFNQAETNKPIVVGWHEPDTFDRYQDDRVVLQLSGHTHGGQVCAPFFDELILPPYGKKYPKGMFKNERSSFLYVNRGLGVNGVPARFMCSPEITVIEMV